MTSPSHQNSENAATTNPQTTVLSIQSHVTYGHVGNSAATFPLQRKGFEVWPLHTVAFSNHTGYGTWAGPLIPASEVRGIVDGIETLGHLADIDLIISGYQGGSDIASAIVDTVHKVKEHNPAALYSCDPVMGNAKSGCFVSDEIPPLLRDHVVPAADIITPNQFELGYLTKREITTLRDTIDAAHAALDLGPTTVLVTSVFHPDQDEATIQMLAVTADETWEVTTPHLPFKRNGSGDVTAALFAGTLAQTGNVEKALGDTAASIYELLTTTQATGSRELELIRAQEAYVNPQRQFPVTRIQ